MTQFRILHAPPYEMTHLSIDITDRYFTVDTADRDMIESWKQKNPHYLTYAFDEEGALAGFIGILPLTEACGHKIIARDLREEDLTAGYVMPADQTQYTPYVYISGLAIRNMDTWQGSQCAAALISAAAGVIRHIYDARYLKAIFANPTTFWGSRLIRKFEMQPLRGIHKTLKNGHDFYGGEVTPDVMARCAVLEKRYQRFINDYPWK